MACFSVCVVLLCSFGLLLVVYGFFFCVFSFGLPFVLPCSLSCIRSYRFPGPFRFPSGVWHAKSAAALRCRLFPGSIRRHRRDIDPIAVWNGSRPARRNRMVVQAWFRYRMAVKERPIPWRTVFPPWPDRPLLAHLLLDRYQVRMVLPRYRIRWMGDSDIGVLRSMPCRWTI